MELNNILSMLRGINHFSTDYNINNTLILSGVARGGTTWIAEILNYNNQFRYMFEPFQNAYVPTFRNFLLNQYIEPSSIDKNYYNKINKILSGKIHNFWIDRFNKKVFYKKILIKAVRMNLILGYVRKNFPEVKIILLLRHPFAVINSRMKLGWSGYAQSFINQKNLYADFLNPYASHIKQCKTDFEKQVCMWCIQNFVPIKQFQKDGNTYICFYELFCEDVERETQKLFSWAGIEVNSLEVDHINRLSKMAKKEKNETLNFLSAWKNRFSDDEIERGIEILKWFGLDSIYGKNTMPIVESIT